MLEHNRLHDELLPVEEENPALIEELRAVYQLTPQEQRVLTNVQERLALYARPLPARETAEASQRGREAAFVSPQLAFPRRKFLIQLNGIAAVLFVALLVGALAFTFAAVKHPTPASVTPTNGIVILLVPAQTTEPSKAALAQTANILSQRVSDFGLQGYSIHVQAIEVARSYNMQTPVIKTQTGIRLILPHFGSDEQQILPILLGTGVLAFWNTGLEPLPLGMQFDPSQFSNLNPGGRPPFTGQDLNPDSLQVGTDPNTYLPEIYCEMQGNAIQRFQQFTSSNIGNYLTFTLDGKVLSSPVLQGTIYGPFVINGEFSHDQAKVIVAVLKYGPLPLAMKRL